MNLILNIIWIIFGGLEMAFGWLAWRWHQLERWSSIKMSPIMDAPATGVRTLVSIELPPLGVEVPG